MPTAASTSAMTAKLENSTSSNRRLAVDAPTMSSSRRRRATGCSESMRRTAARTGPDTDPGSTVVRTSTRDGVKAAASVISS